MLKAIPALAALVAASAFVFPTVSQAAEENSVRVSYADLNLASEVGQHSLKGRIVHAARIACDREDSRELLMETPTLACRNNAVQAAQPAFEEAVAAARHGTVIVGGAAALIVTAQ